MTGVLRNRLHVITKNWNKWSWITSTLILFISIPILTIIAGLFGGPGESFSHILTYLISAYLTNTLILVMGTGIVTILFGTVSAWIVCRYIFPFRSVLEWLLILPLAVPNYLTAYAYAGIFDYSGSFEFLSSAIFSKNIAVKVDIMNVWGLVFVLSASLYPYVYIAARSFFINQSSAQIKAAKILGCNERMLFFRIALPMARPAIVGGVLLVFMEVLNDYGATYYYGVSTFCTAIFRAWFALEEPGTAVYLSALLCISVFLVIGLERLLRRNKRYHFSAATEENMQRIKVSVIIKYVLLMIAAFPVLLGFFFPVLQIIYWVYLTGLSVWGNEFFELMGQSCMLSLGAAVICVFLSLMIIYGVKWSKSSFVKWFSRLSILGYAVPGVVIAVGVLIPSLFFDKWLIDASAKYFGVSIGFIVNGTILGLLFAYAVRFLAVSYNPLEASVHKLGNTVGQAAQTLGASRWTRLRAIELPLALTGIWSAFLLVFVDVMKELPLTLLLKPYGVMTLSAKAYEYASDERIAEAALPSLLIIATGLVPVIVLNRLIKR